MSSAPRRKKIMVVDNNPVILRLMENLLTKAGYEVRTAVDGLSALEILEDFTPAIMFIDLVMPNITGDKLCQIIRSRPRFSDTYIVIFSGIADSVSCEFKSFGANACLNKGDGSLSTRQLVFDALRQAGESVPRFDEEPHEQPAAPESSITGELFTVKSHLEAILANMSEGVLELTANNTIIYANSQAAALLRVAEERLLATELPAWFPAEERPRLEAILKNGTPPATDADHEPPLRLQDRRLHLNVIYVNDADLTTTIVIMRDVTKQLAAEQALRESEELYRNTLENISDVIFLTDRDGVLRYVTPNVEKVFGYTTEEVFALGSNDAFLGSLFPCRPGQDHSAGIENLECSVQGKDGVTHELLVNAKQLPVRGGMVLISCHDITDHNRARSQLQLLASVFENSLEGIAITDAHGIIIRVNSAYTAITGYDANEVIGQKLGGRNEDADGHDLYLDMWSTLANNGYWQGEGWDRRKNGESFPERISVTALVADEGKVSNYVAIFHDITDLKRSERQLEFQSYHDPLTLLPNRQLFTDRLGKAIEQANRHQYMLAVLFLDLDNFKIINDSLGHNIGDRLLHDVAQRLLQCCRSEDTVARLGGDEFMILLPQMEQESIAAYKVAQRIVRALSSPFQLDGHEIHTKASIGITVYPADGTDCDTLIKNADLAMYKAKAEGKNKYAMYTPTMHEGMLRRLKLEDNLRVAMERDEFALVYQPQVDIRTGCICGIEALIRWHRNKGEIVPPGEFIAVAEETGQIFALGEWVLRTAVGQTKRWHDQGFSHLRVGVNLSAKQFQDENIFKLICQVLEETGVPPQALNIEITENIVMENTQLAIKTMNQLAELGVSISIDDFGTGYSSLSYLKRFPLHVLKIDRSFVMDIPHGLDDVAIAQAIIAMANSLKLRVVAEGVETEEQLKFMVEHGCDEIQGYLFSKPLPAEELGRLLQEGRQLWAKSLLKKT